MFLQIGNIIMDRSFSPESLSHTDETTYAEHALITGKPRLQPTGNNLEELSFSIKLRAENIEIAPFLLKLKNSKDTFEVLPVLVGTGQYKGDYVITTLEDETTQALPDGTPIEVTVTISLKEYVITDKLQQQQNAARKQAFAVGDKKPLRSVTPQEATAAHEASNNIALTESHGHLFDNEVRSYSNNVSQQPNLENKMQYRLEVMDLFLQKANAKIANISALQNAPFLQAAIADVRDLIAYFTFPVANVTVLKNINTDLQLNLRALHAAATQLNNLVITRAA